MHFIIHVNASCEDVSKTVTPDLKLGGRGAVVAVPLNPQSRGWGTGGGQSRASAAAAAGGGGGMMMKSDGLGGGSLAAVFEDIGSHAQLPDVDFTLLRDAYIATQLLMREGHVYAGHDVSDGGVLVALAEMVLSSCSGLVVDDPGGSVNISVAAQSKWFDESPMLLLEVPRSEEVVDHVLTSFKTINSALNPFTIATGTDHHHLSLRSVRGAEIMRTTSQALRLAFDTPSALIERLQTQPDCAAAERVFVKNFTAAPIYEHPCRDNPRPPSNDASAQHCNCCSCRVEAEAARTPQDRTKGAGRGDSSLSVNDGVDDCRINRNPPPRSFPVKVAVLRDEGSSGEREVAAAFHLAGMQSWDITVGDLKTGRASLRDFQVLALVGGSAADDALGASRGLAARLLLSDAHLRDEFDCFYRRPDTLSLGLGRGCSLMAALGWIPGPQGAENGGNAGGTVEGVCSLFSNRQPRFEPNESGRFESRFVSVRLKPRCGSPWLVGLGGATLGCWASHAAGRLHFPDTAVLADICQRKQVPAVYVDFFNEVRGTVGRTYYQHTHRTPGCMTGHAANVGTCRTPVSSSLHNRRSLAAAALTGWWSLNGDH
eukprot:GHVU01061362.1.p1 GENE.GHVU01061362.1~~GHVU01061362.1.p1  ORF type:complete len:599 (+),score=71.88 GHVU01061362.1:381-2177(+)